MAVTTIPWGDGTNDNIYLSRNASEGNQTVEVSSDANTGAARSKTVTFSAEGVSPVQLTINQEAGTPPSYITDGLVLWLDGKEKGGTTEWVDKVGGHSFANNGATFNDDHVSFDGDDYLTNTSFSPPASGSGTIEIVYENGAFGTASVMLFAGKTRSGLCFYVSSAKNVIYSIGATSRNKLVATVAKSSTSISNARRYENGVAMSTNGSDYCSGQNTTNHIGRRSTGNYYTGKIYCIRIYNRQLTEAEVLANLAIDNIRFNLGLTL